MTAPKERKRRKYNPHVTLDKRGVPWDRERETRPQEDKKFQARMLAAGYEQRTASEHGTDHPKSTNAYTTATSQSSAHW